MADAIRNGIKSTIPVDRAGRLVLPKAIRTRMQILEEDILEVEMDGDEVRLLRLIASPSRIIREGGRAVWDAPDASASIEEIERAMLRGRQERDVRASGF